MGQSTCRNAHGVFPAKPGKYGFFGRHCGGRGCRTLLGDGVLLPFYSGAVVANGEVKKPAIWKIEDFC